MSVMIEVRQLAKTFTLHTQGGVELPVLGGIDFDVSRGECLVLHAPSGAGKSTLLRTLYANYRLQQGAVRVMHDGCWLELGRASPQDLLSMRERTVGFVSQFLRVIPRVPALDLVAEPLRKLGWTADDARARAAHLLTRLRLPERLWHLPPATFSGGEQQRVNIARSLAVDYPIVLLDEPTASLDARNRDVVIDLIDEARNRGAALVGIFHDADVRAAVGTRQYDLATA